MSLNAAGIPNYTGFTVKSNALGTLTAYFKRQTAVRRYDEKSGRPKLVTTDDYNRRDLASLIKQIEDEGNKAPPLLTQALAQMETAAQRRQAMAAKM